MKCGLRANSKSREHCSVILNNAWASLTTYRERLVLVDDLEIILDVGVLQEVDHRGQLRRLPALLGVVGTAWKAKKQFFLLNPGVKSLLRIKLLG